MSQFDLKSASTHGARDFSRVRALWRNGVLRLFGVDGRVMTVSSKRPTQLSGHLNSWLADTAAGSLILKGKCMTCGGPSWWRIMRMPADELWEVPAK